MAWPHAVCTLMGILENGFPSKQSKAVKMNGFTSKRLFKKLKKRNAVGIAKLVMAALIGKIGFRPPQE